MTAGRRRAILVTGMHRSGTSAVAGVLGILGVDLGPKLVPASEHNQRGYWEHVDIVRVHERLLSSLGRSWDDPAPLSKGWLGSAAASQARAELEEILRRDFAKSSLFAVKDPRISRLLPLWIDLVRRIGHEPFIVLVARHPVEVARSLQSRDGLPRARSYVMWLDYLLTAVSDSRDEARCLMMYSQVLADWRSVFRRLEEALGVRWPRSPEDAARDIEAFLTPQLRHQQASDNLEEPAEAIPSMVKRAYTALVAMPDLSDPALVSSFETLRAQLAEASDLYSPEALEVSRGLVKRCVDLEQGLRAARAELVDVFRAVRVGESIHPVLEISGWYVTSSKNPARLELRCDGELIAEAEWTGASSDGVGRRTFRIETPLPRYGDRFDLVAEESGAILATRQRLDLWCPHVRDAYAAFCAHHTIRRHIRELLSSAVESLERRPTITLVLPVVPELLSGLDETFASLREQIYPQWEAIIAVEECAAELVAERIDRLGDPRIALFTEGERCEPWQRVNAASLAATGEILGVLQPGDRLAPQALFELARRLQSDSVQEAADVLYADHDFVDQEGVRSTPYLKPDWSPIFFLSHDYIERFVFLRYSLFDKCAGFDADLREAAPYDLMLRVTEETDKVLHIPQILFHAKRSGRPEPETYERRRQDKEARLRALRRRALPAHPVVTSSGLSRPEDTVGNLEWPDVGPSVTIVIPTFNQHEILRRCVESILDATTYRNFDVLIVDNESDSPETLDYLERVREDPRVRTIRVPRSGGRFSFAHVNNVAVGVTDAEYVLLLNNDTEILEPRWLSRLMGYARLPGVGVVGARLLYADGRIQHAGIALGMNDGLAPGHLFYRHATDAASYLHLLEASREVSAVTGACLLTKRELFLELGGLDEIDFPVVLNDVDFCLRVAERGLRSVYVAHARLLHLESASRGRLDASSQRAAFRLRHGDKVERYWSSSLELMSGERVAVDPRCRLRYEHLPRPPLHVLCVLPEKNDEEAQQIVAALSAAKDFPCNISLLSPGQGAGIVDARGRGSQGAIQWIDGDQLRSLSRAWDDPRTLTDLIRRARALLETHHPDVLVGTSLEAFPYVNAAGAASVPVAWLFPQDVAPKDVDPLMPPSAQRCLHAAFATAQLVAFSSRPALDSWKHLDTQRVMVVSRIAQEVADLVAEAWQAGPENGPRFGLLVDVEEASEDDVRRTIESIRRQTYQVWDLFLVGGVRAAPRFAFLQAVDSFDYRISVHIDEDSECDLARRRNDALRKAPSSWIGVLEPGDELAPFALDEIAALLDRSPGCQGVYADEDRELPGGRTTVRLKPEWSPEMLLGEFYIGRPWFLRRDVFDGLGGFRGETGVASEWDLWLRAGEKGVPIRRLPIPCCVRRIPPEGDDVASEARNEANVVRDHLRRLGLAAEVERLPNGIQRAFWPIVADPLVSIIIPNRNSLELLRECLDGLRRRTRYPHREILIVDNGSTEAEVLELYDFLTRSGEARVLPLEGAFNYSLACNLGAREANGKLLLFLNNDTEVLEPDWLEEMIRWTQVPGVGVVGCKLLYEDGRIQHAGVTLGLNGTCAHLFSGAGEENTAGPFGSADQYRNLIAVTGACQLLPRDVYEHVGGFDERYSLIFSDVDICLRAREAGYRVVYTPFARLVHHEGSSRAQVSPREDVTRFGRRLDDLGIESDPYFHPGLHGGIPVPTIRQIDEPGASDALRWWMKEALGDMAATAPLDPHRPSELQDLASRWGLELSKPSAVPEQVEVGDSGAVGFIVATLLEDESLHRRFPTALLDGEHGSFCLWLSEEKANELGLSAAARFSIRRALSERPGESIRRLYVNQLHLQRDYPFALTPIGLRSFLRWLLTTGRVEYKLSDDSIWWYCLECWEDGAEGLLDSYLINPNWQKLFPDALTPVGWQQFVEWLAREYPAASGWLRRVAGTGPPSPSPAVYRADAFLRRT